MKAGREQVFLYNFEDAEQLRKLKSVLLCMKARAKIVEPEWFGQPIGALAGLVEGSLTAVRPVRICWWRQ